jgi:putative addiction module component (TIGR02574 family)
MSDRKLNLEALKLSPRRRAKLAERLLASLDDDAQRSIDVAWAKEAESRIDSLDKGTARSKPLSRVLRGLKQRARR